MISHYFLLKKINRFSKAICRKKSMQERRSVYSQHRQNTFIDMLHILASTVFLLTWTSWSIHADLHFFIFSLTLCGIWFLTVSLSWFRPRSTGDRAGSVFSPLRPAWSTGKQVWDYPFLCSTRYASILLTPLTESYLKLRARKLDCHIFLLCLNFITFAHLCDAPSLWLPLDFHARGVEDRLNWLFEKKIGTLYIQIFINHCCWNWNFKFCLLRWSPYAK